MFFHNQKRKLDKNGDFKKPSITNMRRSHAKLNNKKKRRELRGGGPNQTFEKNFMPQLISTKSAKNNNPLAQSNISAA